MAVTMDSFLVAAIDGTACLSHGFAQACVTSPEVKSVADAFRNQYDLAMAEVRLRNLLIFLDNAPWIDARGLSLSNSVDREERKAQVIALLLQAADLLEFSFDFAKDVVKSRLDRELPIARRKQTARKLLKRIAAESATDKAELLRVLVEEIRNVAIDDLMPIGDKERYPNNAIDLSNIGFSGRAASSPESATRGLLVRELNQRLPSGIENKYSVIHKLLAIKGIDLTRQTIRGILLKGKT